MPGPDLAERLRAEAQRLEVGAPPVASVARRGGRHGRLQTAGKGFVVLALVAASTGLGLLVTNEDAPTERATRGIRTGSDRDEAYENNPDLFDRRGRPRSVEQTDALVGGSADAETVGSASSGSATTPSTAPDATKSSGVPSSADRIIKTARINIEVHADSFHDAFAEAELVASRYGGFISDSETTSSPARSGDLVIRVPAAMFETVVADLKSLGKVESERVSGVDVTADFVDLNARLRNWEAQERVLVRLMGEADTINESLQVQRELQPVREEIERIQGQLRVLRDQTDLATISIAMHEPGEGNKPAEKEESAWERAVAATAGVLEAMLVGAAYLLPILVALMIVLLLARAVRSRRET